MAEEKMAAPTVEAHWVKTQKEREEMYKESIEDTEGFWAKLAKRDFHWEKEWTNVRSFNFDATKGDIDIKYFEGAMTNICYNSLDRHIKAGKGDKVAFYWEGNECNEESVYTYQQLFDETCRFANVLKKHGVKKGDRVTVYLPMVGCMAAVVLACTRLGAPLNVVFAGFSANALAARIANCESKIVITAESVFRGSKPIKLKEIVDSAITEAGELGTKVETVVVYQRHNRDCQMVEGRDVWYQDEMKDASNECEVEWVDSEHPSFLLYTSGSTGAPKGVVHTTGGYMVYAATTHKYVFDVKPDDIYWCTADIGWITGHSYIVFGPLINGCTSVLFEGVPTYPDAGRCWQIVDKYKVNSFYTAPTAIRALQKFGDDLVTKYSRESLRVLGSVGEPINVEAWRWYNDVVGGGHCAIMDTWWQTETGGHMITPLCCTPTKPGSASLPFFGVKPAIINEKGEELEGECEGYLVIKEPHPSLCRGVYGDKERYENAYFKVYNGYYFTGDGARRDADGYYWLTGRVDDVLNVSGHRLGTAEIEDALNTNSNVVESAVVGYPHNIKGTGIYVYLILAEGKELTPEVKNDIRTTVRDKIGPIATPDILHATPGLPKTRSGKIMRRILRKIAAEEADQLGDVSTLADPSIVDILVEGRKKV